MVATAKRTSSQKRAAPAPAKNYHNGIRSGLHLFIGLILGLISAGGIYLKVQGPPAGLKLLVSAPPPPAMPQKQAHMAAATTTSQKPKFDFYTMLPNMQVNVPGQQPAGSAANSLAANSKQPLPTLPPPVLNKTTTNSHGKLYFLQIASFQNYSDADKLKAQLAINGFNVTVNPVNVNGTTWNRVAIGPYTTLTAAQNDQVRLQQDHVNSMMIASAK